MKAKYIVASVIAIIIIAIGIIALSMESIVKGIVNKYGSQVTGTEVNLEGFSLSLRKGIASIDKLTVANPEGYTQKNLFSLANVTVTVDTKSLTTDTIIIDSIIVNEPVINYQMLSATKNNIGQILENIKKNTASAEENSATKDTKKEEKAEKPSKQVIIKRVEVNSGQIDITTLVGTANVKFPQIVLTDIGAEKKGISIVESISHLFTTILNTATQAVVVSGVSDLKDAAVDGAKSLTEGVGKGASSLKEKLKSGFGLFGKD